MNVKVTWKSEDGEIEVLPSRARVLQARVSGREAYWTNPDWNGDWNIGGDRLWVSPELSWFWKTNEKLDFEQYEVPQALDPGSWQIREQSDEYCHVEQNIALRHQHEDSNIEVAISRRISLAHLDVAPHWSTHIAYQMENGLQITGGTAGQRVDLWSLIQLPVGGTIHVAAREDAKFRDYFAPITPELWERKDGALQFHITGTQQYKLGISPHDVTGRAAYMRSVGEMYLVVYRHFFPQGWRAYADAPMAEQNSNGDAIQIYNDNGSFGRFGEMEYHTPAIEVGRGAQTLNDSNLCIIGTVQKNDWAAWREYWLHGA